MGDLERKDTLPPAILSALARHARGRHRGPIMVNYDDVVKLANYFVSIQIEASPSPDLWSRKPPTKPGWYWIKDFKGCARWGSTIYPMELRSITPGSTTLLISLDELAEETDRCLWGTSPITVPADPSEVSIGSDESDYSRPFIKRREHAQAVEAAYREGWRKCFDGPRIKRLKGFHEDWAWQDSEAKKKLEGMK